MNKKLSAHELELDAVSAAPKKLPDFPAYAGEAMAMLVRRGLQPEKAAADVPFPQPLNYQTAGRLADWLDHYAFRLFLRGAIHRSDCFLPRETTRYLTPDQSKNYADTLVRLGLAEKISRSRYTMKWRARSFGGTLEWYVARELERRFGFDVATGIKFHVEGVGGDLDVVAAAEGKLVYMELKSSPPKNLTAGEMSAFCDRLDLLRPDVSLFVVDTALRLSDKVVPMLVDALRGRGLDGIQPRRISGQIWQLRPYIFTVNGSRDLMANIGKAIAEGFRALSPLSVNGSTRFL